MKSRLALAAIIAFLLLCGNSYADNFVVTSASDNGPGTLREAIQSAAANGTTTPDLITFNIPYTGISSVTIGILTSLPDITSNVTIDGSTQPSPKLGVSDSRVIIEPLGENNYTSMIPYCMQVKDADNVQMFGLYIKGFSDYVLNSSIQSGFGISLNNSNNFVFGSPGKGNVVAGCTYDIGKFYFTGIANNVTIQSNFFGVDVDGITIVASGTFNNYDGVVLTQANNAVIGGSSAAEGNLFSGNAYGIALIEVTGTIDIGFNKFNTDPTGNIPSNNVGAMGARDSPALILIHDNIIQGESDFFSMSGRFLIVRNFFGTNPSRTAEFTFAGGILDFSNCTGAALIGGNNAADMNVFGNGVLGVGNDNSSKITILHNSFYCHDDGGIYMNWYTLPNKPFVTINKATAAAIEGTARPNAIIELYYTDNCRFCEGKVFINRLNADASGNWKYTGATTGNVTATSTNTDDSTTSAFAEPQTDLSNVIIKNATCNKTNGSITGAKITSGTVFYWIDAGGNIVGRDTGLVNVKEGYYQLVVGIGSNTCKLTSQVFTVGNTLPPTLDTTLFNVTEPSCGRFNGAISYTGVLSPGDSAYWLAVDGTIIQRGILLKNMGQGKYYFRIAAGGDTSCYSSFGPINLVNQSGPSLNIDLAETGNTTCGKNNGFIRNITWQNTTGSIYVAWEDSTGKVVGNDIDLTGMSRGKYFLKFKDGSGCDTIVTPYFIIKDTGTILVDTTHMLVKESSCKAADGAITGISSTNATVFTWINMASGGVAGNSEDINNIPPGSYQLQLNNIFGCETTTNPVQVKQHGFLADTVLDVNISDANCDANNGYIRINRFSSDTLLYSFEWTDSTTNTVVSTSSSIQNLSPGFYILHATDNNGCTQRIFSSGIKQIGKPEFDTRSLQIKDDTCNFGKGSVQNLLMKDLQRSYTWVWYNGQQQQVANTADHLLSLHAGDYYAAVTDQFNCTVTSNTFIVNNIERSPDAPHVADVSIPRNTAATILVIDPHTGIYDLLDNNSPGSVPLASSPGGTFQTSVITADRSFYIRYTSGDCTSALSKVNVKVFDSTIIYVPNAFTPNNDGLNDRFHITVQGRINTFLISIYNRWGNLAYSGTDINGSWDGTMNGQPVPAGVFVYVINATDANNKVIRQRGIVTLFR